MENITAVVIAEKLVDVHARFKALEEELAALKKALINTGVTEVTVGNSTVKVSEGIRQSLDTKAVVTQLGQSWVDKHSTISIYTQVRVTNKAALKEAA
jgi:hypothetical protein